MAQADPYITRSIVEGEAMTIIVHCGSECWIAASEELGIDVQLPFSPEAKFAEVERYLKRFYPRATIVAEG
jgi:hypothetical protein